MNEADFLRKVQESRFKRAIFLVFSFWFALCASHKCDDSGSDDFTEECSLEVVSMDETKSLVYT
jgi:hypothetical protein